MRGMRRGRGVVLQPGKAEQAGTRIRGIPPPVLAGAAGHGGLASMSCCVRAGEARRHGADCPAPTAYRPAS